MSFQEFIRTADWMNVVVQTVSWVLLLLAFYSTYRVIGIVIAMAIYRFSGEEEEANMGRAPIRVYNPLPPFVVAVLSWSLFFLMYHLV